MESEDNFGFDSISGASQSQNNPDEISSEDNNNEGENLYDSIDVESDPKIPKSLKFMKKEEGKTSEIQEDLDLNAPLLMEGDSNLLQEKIEDNFNIQESVIVHTHF